MDQYIDIYCERLEPGLWAEPINALTNAAFFIAGFFALILARRENTLDWKSGLLIALIFAMGLGSTLFHTFAQLWAMMMDVLPILAYQICFIVLYARFIMGWNCWKSGALLAAFFVAMYISMQLPREWLNGSLEYAPALIFVTGFGLYHLKQASREKFGLLAGALTFLISFGFRSVDEALCPALPIGTHFMWHILNGCVLYLTTRAFILNVKPISKTS
ncbi:MAG: ceramidase domain-containing protein [Alphaproteobacteria bacterium]